MSTVAAHVSNYRGRNYLLLVLDENRTATDRFRHHMISHLAET